jgi:CDP-diacylglycerol--glycerol-3-phosphate 3-phosphatidyltransferase
LITIPVVLTTIRFISSLFFLPFLFVYFLPFNYIVYNAVLALFFILIGLTDFFDGYYARKWNQTTILGSLFDPLADKVFMMATFISLAVVGKLWFYWAIIFITREFLVMGVRELALHQGFAIAVGYSGKLKTALQMLLCTFIILNPYQLYGMYAPWWNGSELVLLIGALVLSVGSACVYVKVFCRRLHTIME